MPAANLRKAKYGHAALAYVAAFISIAANAQFDNAPSPAQPANPFDEATSNPSHEEGASKILQGPLRALLRRPLPESDTEEGVAQTQSPKSWPRVYRDGRLLVTGSLTGAAAVFSMSGNEFDKPVALATPGYKA